MFGTKKPKNGQAIISSAVCAFEDTIEELQEGIDLCAADEAVINAEIDELNTKKSAITSSVAKAVAVQKNIRKFLS